MAATFGYKQRLVIGLITLFTLFFTLFVIPQAKAQDREVTLRFGSLEKYTQSYIVVDGNRISLCKNVVILDNNEHPIPIDGLVATETVKVKIKEGCAFEIQALIIRQ